MKSHSRLFLLSLVLFLFSVSLAEAKQQGVVVAEVSVSKQTMTVRIDDMHLYEWPVSTARPGYKTPIGVFTPYLLHRKHYSSIYNNSPMPFSVFFRGNYAIHGTTEVKSLGRPVSHGCVRLLTENAELFFGLVKQFGMQNTRIIITK